MSGVLSVFIREIYLDDKGHLQIAGVGISLGIGLVGGLLVGEATRGLRYYRFKNDYYNDRTNVILEDFVEAKLDIYGPVQTVEESVKMISYKPKVFELVTPSAKVIRPLQPRISTQPAVSLQRPI